MALPSEIPAQYNEEAAGYMSVRPVVRQTFRLAELLDMVLSVTGKDTARIEQIFRAGTTVYNGFRYRWEPLSPEAGEIDRLLAGFPDDEPNRPFDAKSVTAVLFEMGGGTQRTVRQIPRAEASAKRFLAKQSPWDVLLLQTESRPPRYEKYSYSHRADTYRLSLSFPEAQELLAAVLGAAPRSQRRRWSALRPPAAVTFLCPRK